MSYSYQIESQMGLPSVANPNRSCAPLNPETFRDRVAAINLRDLIGDVFRSLQFRPGTNTAAFRMELECNWIVWFPQRLRSILETLVSNSISSHVHSPDGSRVSVYFRRMYPGYELRVTDNTLVTDPRIPENLEADSVLRRDNGLRAVRMLLAESDGELSICGDKGHGTMSIAKLPVYDMGDFLEDSLSVTAQLAP